MSKRKVYIPNHGYHDYSSAKEFGEIVSLTTGSVDLKNISAIIRTMQPVLALSDPSDFILLSGATIINTMACSIFTSLHNRLNLLIFHRKGYYITRNCDFTNLKGEQNDSN